MAEVYIAPISHRGAEHTEVKNILMQLNFITSKIIAAAINVHKEQLLAYLRLANKSLGLLINFNVGCAKGRNIENY